MSHQPADDAPGEETRIGVRARCIVGVLVAGPLLLTALGGLLRHESGLDGLVLPAAVAGAASPVIGFRTYRMQVDAAALRPSRGERRRGFLRAHVLALTATGLAALLGATVHAFSSDPLVLIGPVMHVMLAGALWPTDERLAAFLDRSEEARGEGER